MRINLLLFAVYRDMAGLSEMAVDVADGSSAAVAVSALRTSDARFARLPERPVIAINREYAALDTTLREGDELALLPPVAGG